MLTAVVDNNCVVYITKDIRSSNVYIIPILICLTYRGGFNQDYISTLFSEMMYQVKSKVYPRVSVRYIIIMLTVSNMISQAPIDFVVQLRHLRL